jgi:plastocyanin domain-containing protein
VNVRFVVLCAAVALQSLACSNKDAGAAAATAGSVTPPSGSSAPAEGRLVEIIAGDTGFTPATIPAKKGETLTLRFKRTTKSECLKAIEIADLGIKKDLPLDTPVDVVIKADKEGTITFMCWMKMLGGKVVVSAS